MYAFVIKDRDGSMQLNEITHEIIGCAYEVANQLGVGFLEKVYENALCIELSKQGLIAQQQKIIDVYYKEILVGEYVADLLVEDLVIVELKALERLKGIHQAQLRNYLKATNNRYGLLINFGNPRVEMKRIVHGY